MNDLFKKLNLLVKSGINDVIGDDTSRRAVDPRQLGKDLSREVDTLRSRVNDAIAHEESLYKQIDTLAKEIDALDQAADVAVKQGKEQEAKRILSQMQFARQRLTMAEADLQEHQLVTADLIRRVNLLDSVVSEAQGQQARTDEGEDTSVNSTQAIQDSIQQRMNTLSDLLKTARDKVSSSISAVSTDASEGTPTSDADSTSRLAKEENPDPQSTLTDDDVVQDEFEARLQRLSKPKKP